MSLMPFSVIEVSDLLGVSRQTVHGYIRAGYIRPVADVRPLRVTLAEVERVSGQKFSEGKVLRHLRRASEAREVTRRKGAALNECRT